MADFNQPPRLILASGSPRRAALLREHGYDFDIVVPGDEPAQLFEHLPPIELAEALSLHKAQDVARRVRNGWILSGDTIAALGDRVIGKPADRDDARAIITALSGTTHRVITGVTLLDAATGRAETAHDVTAVTMRPLSPDEIEQYLDTGDWQGKAGAYGIQDRGDEFVTRVDGSFTNVVGFPMELIRGMLEAHGVR